MGKTKSDRTYNKNNNNLENKKKRKKNKADLGFDVAEVETNETLTIPDKANKSNRKTAKQKISSSENTSKTSIAKPKKIKFDDDDQNHKVPSSENTIEKPNDELAKTKKRKKNEDDLGLQNVLEVEANDTVTKKANKHKRKKQKIPSSEDTIQKPKKIKFDDDDQPESEAACSSEATTKKKKFLNDDEADVKPEDIDKFCDELDEEDNVQFENWVKLVEEKLHRKK